MRDSKTLMLNAWKAGTVIPAFNIPYLPMMKPVIKALQDTNCFGLIAVSRPDWEKFEAKSIRAVYETYLEVKDERVARLHLDHVPVIDEDNKVVDYVAILTEAVDLGYESVMIDSSRLSFADNIAATQKIVNMAHKKNVPVEAELGAVMGHEDGPMPSYEELFTSGLGFTDPDEAKRFVDETDVDWLSVAVGSVHGALSAAKRDQKKVEARLNIDRIKAIQAKIARPMVLHGGSGIRKEYLLESFKHGIAKINIGTAIRQAYEQGLKESAAKAYDKVYRTTVESITDELQVEGSAQIINP
ncbi:class II fructose-bisphosphate aldolase [candidate division KSB1 bacterium]|nr:MAG: class II fructose-bisphosphate aldolase [candidate division KSB1 bacterium]